MKSKTAGPLTLKKCKPCESGCDILSAAEARTQVDKLSGWRLTHQDKRIRKDWTVKDFMAGVKFFDRIAKLAESEGHHPDLHLEGYRKLWIELSTHAISGLSENDLILAAKIDELPVDLKV